MNSSFRQLAGFLLIPAVILLPFLSACDSPPGATPYPVSSSPFVSITLDPDSVSFSPEAGIKDTTLVINISVSIRPDSDLQSPSFNVVRESDRAVFRDGSLNRISDSELEGAFSFNVPTTIFETYTVFVFEKTDDGGLTNTLEHKLSLSGFTTDPPVILGINHPSSVQIPNEGVSPIRFETEVEHPQGLSQIRDVFLELYDSAGNQIGGDRFEMFDDGDDSPGGSGDQVAGDGIYTRTFEINPNNQPDTYDVLTYAIDRSGLTSDTLTSQLVIE